MLAIAAAPATPSHLDRRDSPRIPIVASVRREGSPAPFLRVQGDVSLSGFAFLGTAAAPGDRYQVRFRVSDRELNVRATVLRSHPLAKGASVHLSFDELPIRQALALARFLQTRADVSERTVGGSGR